MNDQAEGRYHGGCLIPSASRGRAMPRVALLRVRRPAVISSLAGLFFRHIWREEFLF
jgi:hypothetical protein